MAEEPKTVTTFTFEDHTDGRYYVKMDGDPLSTPKLWVLWTMCMESLIEAPNLKPDKRALVREVYNRVMSPAETLISKSKEKPLRIVTIYARPGGIYQAVEFLAKANGAERTDWVATGAYDIVIGLMWAAFGTLTRMSRNPTDAPEILESWI